MWFQINIGLLKSHRRNVVALRAHLIFDYLSHLRIISNVSRYAAYDDHLLHCWLICEFIFVQKACL